MSESQISKKYFSIGTPTLLVVYHDGKHNCQEKPNTSQHDDYIEQCLRETGCTMGPKQLAQMKMTYELQKQKSTGTHDMAAIIEIASTMTDKKKISNIKKKITSTLRNEVQSLSAVAELKSTTDTQDQYYIYKINDITLNGNMSYVFKSSRVMANIAIKMDVNGNGEDPLKHEMVYFDGMHSRVNQWKTLTAWVYHPPSRKLLRIATMECKGENAETVKKFWTTLNEILREVKQDQNYLFNPKGFLTDEAGANINGILGAFGMKYMNKINTCQFHFKQCVKTLLSKIPGDFEEIKNEVQSLSYALTTVSTLNEYGQIKSRLLALGGVIPPITKLDKLVGCKKVSPVSCIQGVQHFIS